MKKKLFICTFLVLQCASQQTGTSMGTCSYSNYREYVIQRGRNCTVECVNGEERIKCHLKICTPEAPRSVRDYHPYASESVECDPGFQRNIYVYDLTCSPNNYTTYSRSLGCASYCRLGFVSYICTIRLCTPSNYIADNGQNCTITCNGCFEQITCSLDTTKQSPACAYTNFREHSSCGQRCIVECVDGEERIICWLQNCKKDFHYLGYHPTNLYHTTVDTRVTVGCDECYGQYNYTTNCYHSTYIVPNIPHCEFDCLCSNRLRVSCTVARCAPRTYIAANGQNCTVTCKGPFKYITCSYRECEDLEFTADYEERFRRYCEGGEEKYITMIPMIPPQDDPCDSLYTGPPVEHPLCGSLPGVIGAIDCTHVRIKLPGKNEMGRFYNRKQYYSLNVQAVVDAKMRFRNLVCRWPGATHDSRIFQNSILRQRLINRERIGHLIGDGGYASTRYLLTPVRDPTTPAERAYNAAQIRARNVVERAFGVLKSRFPCLGKLMRLRLNTTQSVIVACAVLHNIAMLRHEPQFTRVAAGRRVLNGDEPLPDEDNGTRYRDLIIEEHFS